MRKKFGKVAAQNFLKGRNDPQVGSGKRTYRRLVPVDFWRVPWHHQWTENRCQKCGLTRLTLRGRQYFRRGRHYVRSAGKCPVLTVLPSPKVPPKKTPRFSHLKTLRKVQP